MVYLINHPQVPAGFTQVQIGGGPNAAAGEDQNGRK
jgi:hypothetical protein